MSNPTPLNRCPPGFTFRLFSRYRDSSPRPRFKFGQTHLNQHELTVEEVLDDRGVVIVSCAGKRIPVWGGLRVVM